MIKKIFLIAVIVTAYFGILLTIRHEVNSKFSRETKSWNAEKAKKFANKLKTDGLLDQAEEAYEEYLDESQASPEIRANTYFNLGKSFMKQAQYEKALAYFYKTEIVYPETSLKQELGINIVTCLEKLGKTLDAAAMMEERVSTKKDQNYENTQGEMVAKIGDRLITMGEIHDQLEGLPPYVQSRFKGEEKLANFIEHYIINEILLKKAISLQYHKDPEVRKQSEIAQQGFIVQKLVQEQLSQDIEPDAYDLKTYYEANLDQYQEETEDGSKIKSFEEVADIVQRDYLLEKVQVKLENYISELFVNYDVQIFYKSNVSETQKSETEYDSSTKKTI